MPLSDADKTLILETVRDAARREIMPRFRALSEADINTKSAPDDLVTAADLAAEAPDHRTAWTGFSPPR